MASSVASSMVNQNQQSKGGVPGAPDPTQFQQTAAAV